MENNRNNLSSSSDQKSQAVAGPEKKVQKYKTDGGKTKSNAIEIPSISLPKGGGAIKGIDQKFSVNAVNGTSSFSIPLPISKARGAVPQLNLSYNSGGGNGIFGLGWSLSLPSIKRKTDKKLPEYNDYIDSDVYLLSEAEDLVPEFERDTTAGNEGKFIPEGDGFKIKEDTSVSGWTIRFYKPRIEGLFARIERWTNNTTREIKWRVISKENLTTLYGWSSASRIADPANPLRIYEWLPEMLFDDKGNCAIYKYTPEDDEGFDPNLPHNRNRFKSSAITYTNTYINKILYGNQTPFEFGDSPLAESDFMFQTVFDYGQYDSSEPYELTGVWDFRPDPFSEYKPGFEIRTTRLCKRILTFHYFTGELIDDSALVKSLDFTYSDNSNEGFTFLNAVTSRGYIKYATDTYSDKSLPPMEFTYSSHEWNKEIKEVSTDNSTHAPTGIKSPYQFTDLYNEGLSGILSEQAGAWYYKRNLGEGDFEAAHKVAPKPSFTGLGGSLQLLDLDSDGVKQIVSFNGSPRGFFELDDDNEWQRFTSFKNLPNINLNDPHAKLIDLNGDGKTDVLLTEDRVFTWWQSAGREGFNDFHRTPKFLDEEEGPRLVFAENTQTIHLADMSGDGLVDLVRIRNGEICYWPNLGYGRFGSKIVMDNSPVFDNDADFNPAYIKLADIDGSGTPDVIYLGKNKFSCWLNFSGNSYSTAPFEIQGFPEIHREADISITDLLGTGLSCIVWSSSLQKDTQSPLRYIDLMNSKKPHIMISHVNNMGLEVELEYTPSTKFYIEDKLAGQPWVTKLHFPVYCVSKVITYDKVTGHVFTNTYSYHHGYYDHAEKEFRGFGRVDQTDTESAEHFVSTTGTNLVNAQLNQAAVLTRSWFHTGAYLRDKKILDQFADEYWYEEYNRKFSPTVSSIETTLPPARILADNQHAYNQIHVDKISAIEKREALRACKSMPLRVEVFALEGSTQEQNTPYTVSTHNCMVELLQPSGQNRHAVFCVKESEAITYTYERRDTNDGRVAHKLNLELDLFGNILKSASVVYPRLVVPSGGNNLPSETDTAQAKTAITYTVNSFTNDVDEPNYYRLRLPAEIKTYEVTKMASKTGANGSIYSISDFDDLLGEDEIAYENTTPSTSVINIRLIEHLRHLYYDFDLSAPMSLGSLSAWGLPYENYQLAYTNDPANSNEFNLVNAIFGNKVGSTELNAGDFHQFGSDTRRWIRSGVVSYVSGAEDETDALARFFIPLKYTDPCGNDTTITYDSLSLFVEETSDAVGNVTTVDVFDYRTLMPVKMKDPNDNLSEIILDELGLPKAMALYGKGAEADDLSGLTPETLSTELIDIAAYFDEANAAITDSDELTIVANDLLQNATVRFVYDMFAYMSSGGIEPCVVSTIMREEHYAVNPDSPVQISFEYSNGSGKVVMKKVQAEPGIAKQVVPTSSTAITVNSINTADGSSSLGIPSLRWIGNGRTVFNNKGNPIKQYEPFFSVTAKYENTKELVENGVTPLLKYDALGRNVRTDFPDGTFTKTDYFGWKQVIYDQNDTCQDSDWYAGITGGSSTELQDAKAKAGAHYNTPKTLHFDTLGRVVSEQETDGTTNLFTHLQLDIEGNLRKVTDARNIDTMAYKYDMLGQMVYQNSADSGQRWLLHNCMGKPLRTWDERDFKLHYAYDALNRPLTVTVKDGDGAAPLDNIVNLYEYGDDTGIISMATAKTKNLRGNLLRHWDTGGLVETSEYYFNGQAKQSERWLASDYKNEVDWNVTTGKLETASFTISTQFDALGRIKEQTAPDNSIITPSYNERGLFTAEDVDQGGGDITHLSKIEYDAKGQRTYVESGNGVYTQYTYDKNTFRLTRLRTRASGGAILQDLKYTYDAVGNITWKQDDNIPDVFYNNSVVSAANEYTYDAFYRLTEATGREHIAGATFGAEDNWQDTPFIVQHNISDNVTMQNYTQTYQYDDVGNITRLQHSATNGSYTRDYTYDSSNNRLLSTDAGTGPYNLDYEYLFAGNDKHGFITAMPHLHVMEWNFKEELTASSTQLVSPGETPETTWYQYDSQGKRLRKITENYSPSGPGTQKNMRIYIEGYEYYEDFNSTFVTETLSLIDNGQRFVMIENRTEPGVPTPLTRYIHPNHQSSCTLETDDNGDVITYEEYHPFGTTSYQATNPAINAAAKRYRYTGMERDEETGLNYHNARYYLPWLGRWINPDPIGIGDGVNVYAYCKDNPVMNLDSKGTQTVEPPKSDEEIPLFEQITSPKGSSDNPILLDEVTITAIKTSVTAGEAARMADNVYGDPNAAELINGWQKSELKIPGVEFNNSETGFQSALYERTNAEGVTEYAYVFAGTNDLLTDAKEDAAQALGMDAPQFEQAARNARTISDALRGYSLTFVGHSLGGGLASAAALATGRNAITFNAAGLHSNTKAANDLNMQAQIDAYIVQGEIVDYSQSSLGLATAEGTRHELKASYVPQIWGTNLDDAYRTYQRVENHLMGTVIQKMQQQGIR